MEAKVREEISKVLASKDTALIKFQDGSISKQLFDGLTTLSYNDMIKIAGSEEQLFGQVKRLNAKIRIAAKLPSGAQTRLPATEAVEQTFAAPTPFSDELKNYIPQKDGYIARSIYGTTDVKLLQAMYDNKDFALLIGETGCGKTHLARHVAYVNKVPYMRVNMNGATTPEDLAGQWIPNPNPENPAKYVWQDGVLTKFMRTGGIFVVDEINMAPADILSMLHSVTDDERRLVLTQKDGEVIIAHPNFWFISTMNPDYEGTKPLNLALKDRFRIIVLGYSDRVERRLQIDEKLLDVASKLRKSEEITTPVSTRDLIKFRDDKIKYGDQVARAYFINNFDDAEQPVVKEIVELTLDNYSSSKSKGGDDE